MPSISSEQVYESENLVLVQISDHVYQHVSYLNTESFGRVECNGMVVLNEGEAVVFDTPTDDKASQELIKYLAEVRNSRVIAVIPTHFHADCVGGLAAFHSAGIPSYASERTLKLLAQSTFPVPEKAFSDGMTLPVGGLEVLTYYPGAGHTADNVVGYVPQDRVLFGGCLVKAAGAGKGNLDDADVPSWPGTIRRVGARYPEAAVVIPGHGKAGGRELLDYTARLFE